jgi:ABC-2 type transport system ATP-binding protein
VAVDHERGRRRDAVAVLASGDELAHGAPGRFLHRNALCLGALLVEAKRPRAGWPVLALLALAGLLRPDAGRITVDGIDALSTSIEARRRIGYLPEVARLHEVLTPWEFLLLKGRLFDVPDATVRARGERLLAGFGLLDRGSEPMVGFSKGMVQKVSIAAALITDPRLLVFDEPLSGLDVTTTLVVKELMREFAARGGAVLHCSHLLDVVETTAHRIAVLDRGRLLACGTAAELRTHVGAGADVHLDSVFRSLVKASDPVAVAKAILG